MQVVFSSGTFHGYVFISKDLDTASFQLISFKQSANITAISTSTQKLFVLGHLAKRKKKAKFAHFYDEENLT